MHQTSDPRCHVHGDFRLDNMLFNLTDADQPIVVADWLMVGVGCGASDIDYSTRTALHPDMRRTEENGAISHYQTSLIRCGVPDL
jgi:aminoglycoside phosphotransferase (APT) family kinase protein